MAQVSVSPFAKLTPTQIAERMEHQAAIGFLYSECVGEPKLIKHNIEAGAVLRKIFDGSIAYNNQIGEYKGLDQVHSRISLGKRDFPFYVFSSRVGEKRTCSLENIFQRMNNQRSLVISRIAEQYVIYSANSFQTLIPTLKSQDDLNNFMDHNVLVINERNLEQIARNHYPAYQSLEKILRVMTGLNNAELDDVLYKKENSSEKAEDIHDFSKMLKLLKDMLEQQGKDLKVAERRLLLRQNAKRKIESLNDDEKSNEV